MKKWLIVLMALTLAVAATTAVTFAVVGNGSATSEKSSASGAEQPSEEVRHQYDLKVWFTTSATQADIDEVEALLRTYDEHAELLMTFCYPPMGTAIVTTDAPDFCGAVEAELGEKSYVDDVACGRCSGSRCNPEGPPPSDPPPISSDEAPAPVDPADQPSDTDVVHYLYDVTVRFNTSATQ